MSIKYLTKEQILAIHLATMKRHDDLEQSGIKYYNEFEAMLKCPGTSLFGEEQFPSTIEKGCCYYHSIAKNHIFHNGNKRTALATFMTYLRLNGLDVTFTNKESEDFTVYVATDEKFKTNDCITHLVTELTPYIIKWNH